MSGTRHQKVFEPDVALEDRTAEPRQFKVLIHNDDYTTMDFVVDILTGVFGKSEAEAVQIMLAVHNSGVGVCGIYTVEVAETKVALVHARARKEGFPLRCSMEEV